MTRALHLLTLYTLNNFTKEGTIIIYIFNRNYLYMYLIETRVMEFVHAVFKQIFIYLETKWVIVVV